MGYKPGGTENNIIRESRTDNSPIPEWAKSTTSFDTDAALTHIAETMYAEGNPNFILAYALHDGIMKKGRNRSYSYKNGTLSIEDKVAPEPYQTKYVKKLRSFFKLHQPVLISHVVERLDVRRETLNDPESPIRQTRLSKP